MVQDEYFQIRSWHILKTENFYTSRANIDFSILKAYCGKTLEIRTDDHDQIVKDGFPWNEKTCETCLRLVK